MYTPEEIESIFNGNGDISFEALAATCNYAIELAQMFLTACNAAKDTDAVIVLAINDTDSFYLTYAGESPITHLSVN